MAQFVVYVNDNPATRTRYPLLLEMQCNFLGELNTTVVAPLSPSSMASEIAMTRLNPRVTVDSKKYSVITQELAGIRRSELKHKVCDLNHARAELTAAIGFLFFGF